jgi:D-cysteine desulfhydrase
MGTAAGLALGFALRGAEIRVEAVRVVGTLVTNEGVLRRLLGSTSRLVEAGGVEAPPVKDALALVRLHHDQIGQGYGRPTAAGTLAVERLSDAPFSLDPTYTAKAAAGLLGALERGKRGPISTGTH